MRRKNSNVLRLKDVFTKDKKIKEEEEKVNQEEEEEENLKTK